MKEYLFAYGTLITGGLDARIDAAVRRHTRHIEDAWVTGRLFDLGSYPGAIKTTDSSERVHGVLLELLAPRLCLNLFDSYEGFEPEHPANSLYLRERSHTHTAQGKCIDCWGYWLRRQPPKARLIQSGDWRRYLSTGRRKF